jgi:hypothetical protein
MARCSALRRQCFSASPVVVAVVVVVAAGCCANDVYSYSVLLGAGSMKVLLPDWGGLTPGVRRCSADQEHAEPARIQSDSVDQAIGE